MKGIRSFLICLSSCVSVLAHDINVYNPDNQIVGLAQIDPEKNRVTTTFNNYFQTHPNNKLMSLELDTLYSEEVDEGEHLTLDFEGRNIHVSVGKVQSLLQVKRTPKMG